LRRWRIAAVLAGLSWLPVGVAAMAILGKWCVMVLVPLVVVIMATNFRVDDFPCPHCGNAFAVRNLTGLDTFFRPKCAHCRIEIGTPRDPDRAEC
jgi:hypothetical protein